MARNLNTFIKNALLAFFLKSYYLEFFENHKHNPEINEELTGGL